MRTLPRRIELREGLRLSALVTLHNPLDIDGTLAGDGGERGGELNRFHVLILPCQASKRKDWRHEFCKEIIYNLFNPIIGLKGEKARRPFSQ